MTSYFTLKPTSIPVLIKEKGSKFIAYAFHVSNENEVKNALQVLKKEHLQSTHICYAFQIGKNNPIYRMNDDGEPNYSAGLPIYQQIQGAKITNVLIAVVRYYGGTKLGVGGLISAYKKAAKECIETSEIIERDITIILKIVCEYSQLGYINKLLHTTNHTIISQNQLDKCNFMIEFPISKTEKIMNDLKEKSIYCEKEMIG